MDINKLNYLLQDIYIKDHSTFNRFYNNYSKVIKALSLIAYKEIKNKSLYDTNDFVQEIWLKLLGDLSRHQYLFYTKEQFHTYLEKVVNETVIDINN